MTTFKRYTTRPGAAAFLLLIVAVFLFGCDSRTSDQEERPSTGADDTLSVVDSTAADTTTWTEMRNVHFRLTKSIALNIRHLQGEMVSRRKRKPIFFDDPTSFLIRIHSAEVGMTPQSLSNLLNNYVFAYPDAPLGDLKITLLENQIKQSGIMHKGVPVPFEITAELSPTSNGNIRVHPTEIQVTEISAEELMDALNLYLEELLDLGKAPGIWIENNDLIMDPEQILPPPRVQGRITSIQVKEDQIIQIFGSPSDTTGSIKPRYTPPLPQARNYMFFRGDTLRFGKLFMIAADLQIVDADSSDLFDFYLKQYKTQLVAGYSRIMPDFGLAAYMPDYDTVEQTVEEGERLNPVPARPNSDNPEHE